MNDNVTNNDTANSTVELKILLSDIWRGAIKFGWIVVVLALVLGGIQFYRSYVRFTPEYTVSATFTVQTENKVLSGENNVSAYSFFYNKNTAGQFADVFPDVVSNPILVNKVCEELGVAIMPASISAECITDTNMITLTATGRDPQLTYDSLQSVINNYSSVADHIIGRTKIVVIDEPLLPVGPDDHSLCQRFAAPTCAPEKADIQEPDREAVREAISSLSVSRVISLGFPSLPKKSIPSR